MSKGGKERRMERRKDGGGGVSKGGMERRMEGRKEGGSE